MTIKCTILIYIIFHFITVKYISEKMSNLFKNLIKFREFEKTYDNNRINDVQKGIFEYLPAQLGS